MNTGATTQLTGAALGVVLTALVCAPAIAGPALRLSDGPQTFAAPTAAPAQTLSLQQAIDDALASNVQTLLADARRDEVAGDRKQARAAFLPHVSADASQSRRSTNLAAQGINVPGFPSVVTYNSFDARAQLRQNLFDYSAYQTYRSAKIGEDIAADQLALAREQVATTAALDYVSALAARATVGARQADLDLATRLTELAHHQEQVGIGTGVDVTRAQTREARARARLAQARTDRTRADIALARTIGLPLDAPLAFSDDLHYAPVTALAGRADIAGAMAERAEIRIARSRIAQRERQLAGARGARLPTISVNAAYGDSGNTYRDNVEDTYSIGAQIQVPIFDGGAISGRIDSAASRLEQQRIRYRDTRDQVEQDVLLARRTLTTLAQQVRAAQSALDLAQRELTLSRDRFSEGISDNVEVIDAQASLADARNTRVAALADYTRARINLAAARGRASRFSLHEPATP